MQDELIEYLTLGEKIALTKRLLKSGLVYDHVKSLMLKKSDCKDSLDLTSVEKKKERERFDKTRDYASVLNEEYVLPDRLRNYREIMKHELIQMHLLLKTKEVRMQVVKDILEEEGLDLKKYFSKSCDRMVKNLTPGLIKRVIHKMGYLIKSSNMKENN